MLTGDPPAPTTSTSPEIETAQRRLRVELDRADRAIGEAMRHADSMFQTPYRGPERRREPR